MPDPERRNTSNYYVDCKKALGKILIWGDKEYSPVRFEYKMVSKRYMVTEIWTENFGVY